MKTQCPHCGVYYQDIPQEYVDEIVLCDKCKNEFKIEDIDAPPPPTSPLRTPPRMSVSDLTRAPKQAPRCFKQTHPNHPPAKPSFTLSGFLSAAGWVFVLFAVACCVMGFVEKQDTSQGFLFWLLVAIISFVLAKVTKDKI